MFKFSYQYCNHTDYLRDLAKFAGVPMVNNTLFLPSSLGNGYIKVAELANGLQVLINECVINEDVSFFRHPAVDESYTLRFDEVKNLKKLSLRIDEDQLYEDEEIHSGAFLTNSLSDISYTATAGTEDRCINIFFTADWLQAHTGISATDEVFKQYLSLKTATFNFEVLNFEYRALMEEVFEIDDSHPMQKVMLQNRVMLLLEKFFRSLYSKLGHHNTTKNLINDVSIKQMMKVESILVSNLSAPPPTIPVLARTAMMSETKLKNLFKTVYGLNLYEYYQKNRMLKARQLLRSKKYSVKEAGMALGFKNLSNFTIAYKKEFNSLPSEI
ncbi:helix-turn-helix transcriptional regulator [Ferruginibacter sp. SUN106]|uniref:helix-turn-helix transcriptional regulator n=1 Tax=Ferruginibacter sp. SUN106 TaxID=2978348 RepID=UPI003D369ED7